MCRGARRHVVRTGAAIGINVELERRLPELETGEVALVAPTVKVLEVGSGTSRVTEEPVDAARLPYGVVQIPDEIVNDPQLLANDIIVPIDDGGTTPRYTVNSPVTIKEAPKVAPRVAPELGEHTDEVLRDLGFGPAQIDGLRASGAIPEVPHMQEATAGGGR